MKNKIIIVIIVLAIVTFCSGAGILAFASQSPPASQGDPLITLSYLTNVFTPQIMAETDKAAVVLTADFEARIAELEAALQANQSNQTTTPDDAKSFKLVTLAKGQTLTCSVGAEMMLRIGTATGVGSAPALVDYTDGVTLSAGTALVTNHMYLVTIENNGAKASTDNVKILVRGTYSIK